jgi:hypothetical protein
MPDVTSPDAISAAVERLDQARTTRAPRFAT